MRYTPHRLLLTLAALAAFALLAVAWAQAAELPEASFDPRVWVGSAAAGAAAIFAATGFIKEHVLTSLKGPATLAVSFGLGIVGAVALSFTSIYDAGVAEAASFGFSASVLASGGYDALAGAVGKAFGSKS